MLIVVSRLRGPTQTDTVHGVCQGKPLSWANISHSSLQSLKQAGNFIQNQKLPPPFWFKMELNVYAVLYWVCDELVQDGIIRANV